MLHTLFSCLERFNVLNSSAKSRFERGVTNKEPKMGLLRQASLGQSRKVHHGTDMVKLSIIGY